ncbi:hypothetical protein [Streptomyces scabiei]|uniref:hypothetical protein n=1 Tax=Streptomyces scabiei TaxID=1930 RepID=UPI000566273F|nr:hypothetical protein [Streptomyces scabiei]MDX2829444.1 hypothetical protein [Streptomyces scabiei]MDX3675000.1 hypothetical protein [Streptomyces scabiei]
MTDSIAEQASLFGIDDEPAEEQQAVSSVDPDELRHATARLAVVSSPDLADPQRRKKVLLVVDCPFCEHQHIHPGGHVGSVQLGDRRARCVGQPGGRYLIKAVDE